MRFKVNIADLAAEMSNGETKKYMLGALQSRLSDCFVGPSFEVFFSLLQVNVTSARTSSAPKM